MNILFTSFILSILIFLLSKTIKITHTYVVRLSKHEAENLGLSLMHDGRGSMHTIDCGKGKKVIIKIE